MSVAAARTFARARPFSNRAGGCGRRTRA
jgi:hypothetical protein